MNRIKEMNKRLDETEQEIERLTNIINELEKWLEKKEKLTFNSWNKGIHEVQRKLQELKGSENNDEKLLKKYIKDLIKADMVEKVEE